MIEQNGRFTHTSFFFHSTVCYLFLDVPLHPQASAVVLLTTASSILTGVENHLAHAVNRSSIGGDAVALQLLQAWPQ